MVTVYLMHRTYKRFYKDGKVVETEKNMMNYLTFIAAFTLEDGGQTFFQFMYYERYDTELKLLTIVNGTFMILMSFKSMLDLANCSVDRDNGLYK